MKQIINRLLDFLDLKLVNKTSQERISIQGALSQIKKHYNFSPRTIVDVGAAFGEWSRICYQIFPKARYLLFEPLNEYQQVLKKFADCHKNIKYIQSAVGSKNSQVNINVHKDLVGSSILEEANSPFSADQPRKISMITLDKAIKGFKGPYLIKIDVQGLELEVLLGAKKILESIEYIILEVSLFQSMKNCPQLFEVVNFMKKRGFVVYDIVGRSYRPLDNALAQVDMVFVKENGQFRKDHRYCTPKQRKKQNKEFIKKNKEKFRRFF